MESNQQHIHSFEHIVVPSTCTQRGYTLHRCACGYEHKDQFTPQSQHTFALVEEIEPGCTADGACKTRCSQCGQERVTPIPAVGHKWGEWTVQQYATCTESGLQIRPCTRCDAIDERSIPATGHKIVSEVRNGVEEYYCVNCGMPMEKPVAAPVMEKPVQAPFAEATLPPMAAPVQPPKAAPAQPQKKAPKKAKKGKGKAWLIAILSVILALVLAVSAIYVIKPDFYYDILDEYPALDILGDIEYEEEEEDEEDEEDEEEGDKGGNNNNGNNNGGDNNPAGGNNNTGTSNPAGGNNNTGTSNSAGGNNNTATEGNEMYATYPTTINPY